MRFQRAVEYLRLLRVHHYLKNGFIFLPLFFAGEIMRLKPLCLAWRAFVCFSLLASFTYIFNDLKDLPEDREHPTKRLRPLANEAISKRAACVTMALLLIVGLGLSLYWFHYDLIAIVGFYLVLNILYSIKLKHVPIVDIAIIAVGFVIRLFVGSAAAHVPLTVWIITMTFLLALFLGFAKRRDDVLIYSRSNKKTRKSIDGYNLEFVNAGMVILSGSMIVSYLMYTLSPQTIFRFGTDKLYLTTIFVILGVLRYLQISFVEENSGSPTTVLLKDAFLKTTIILWFLSFIVILYVRSCA
jgi:decaprenyl-phosphate phosphoribosyltransferase